ncbi:hypothetical protein LMG31884_01400 [Xanthomonas hydrangeae]|uniref:hypothetical protein n=1 Tax=Xanthomonas TaxID=338 RepID=UPI00141A985D|nr:hypothetical protein [Xanthomonas cannabis]CAD7712519.1 hypothetical protein LMG31884_01400 [Xanthomonas hydrangeae]NIK00655.1 hypothetical protein [Xanthomonas cannabis]CAD7712520.1 hypothetical protein LMG31884_01400 [Xanthomonas hydrangeae]CAD7717613.1 hypothetical protein LMG31887_01400 [Xanthomonas hydrangeae]CAD7717615.1 hypothetical protein LMG31887_01400 [Xanthomonas hydrangeae]
MIRFLKSTLLGLILIHVTMALVIIMTKLFGDQCWAPRMGGLMVGFAVFAQGYVYANTESFQRRLRSGLTAEQRVMHVVYVCSVLGTFLWALGDFFTNIYGVTVCAK